MKDMNPAPGHARFMDTETGDITDVVMEKKITGRRRDRRDLGLRARFVSTKYPLHADALASKLLAASETSGLKAVDDFRAERVDRKVTFHTPAKVGVRERMRRARAKKL